ncbi:hypothetical protein ACOSQ3_004489 [Xanthoceras sorbifolium]
MAKCFFLLFLLYFFYCFCNRSAVLGVVDADDAKKKKKRPKNSPTRTAAGTSARAAASFVQYNVPSTIPGLFAAMTSLIEASEKRFTDKTYMNLIVCWLT